MDFSAEPSDPNRFRCSIKNFIPKSTNQKRQPTCLPNAIADLSTILYRMNGMRVDSSPQPIIDNGILNFHKVTPFMKDFQKGLQSKNDYEYVITKEVSDYQPGNHLYLDDVIKVKGRHEIKDAILQNFCQNGPKVPIAVSISFAYISELMEDPTLAKTCFAGDPYQVTSPPAKQDDRGKHAILITGVDLTNEDEKMHSVEIRNSWGHKWGYNGYTKVTFDFFDQSELFVPVLDVENRRLIQQLCINSFVVKSNIKDMCFSAHGHLLATACEDGVRIFDLHDASSKHIRCSRLGDGSCPTTVCFDEDLSIVVCFETQTGYSLCKFGEDKNKECCLKWRKDALPRNMSIAKLLVGNLKGTKFLVTSTEGAQIRIWHGQDYMKESKTGSTAKDNIITISRDGRYIAAVSSGNIMRVWVLSDGKNSNMMGDASEQAEGELTFKLAFHLAGLQGAITSLDFTPDSTNIVTASQDGFVRIWDISSCSTSFPEPPVLIEYTHQDFTGTNYYERISISPDGKTLAVAGASLLRWISLESRKVLETIGRAHNGNITFMTWTPARVGYKDISVLATAGVDNQVKLWAAPKSWAAPS